MLQAQQQSLSVSVRSAACLAARRLLGADVLGTTIGKLPNSGSSGAVGLFEPVHDAGHVRLGGGDAVILGNDLRVGIVG